MSMRRPALLILSVIWTCVCGFKTATQNGMVRQSRSSLLMSDPLKRLSNIAKDKLDDMPINSGTAKSMGGAVAGGLLLGPIGAIMGAALASSSSSPSSDSTLSEQTGIPKEIIQQINIIVAELQQAQETRDLAQDQFNQNRKQSSKLRERETLQYAMAKNRLEANDDAGAREALADREETKALLVKTTAKQLDSEDRVKSLLKMEEQLTSRLKDLEALVLRARTANVAQSVSAAATVELFQDSMDPILPESSEDLIEQRFRDLETK